MHGVAHGRLGAPGLAALQHHQVLIPVEFPAGPIHGHEGDAQVLGQPRGGLLPVGLGDLHLPQAPHRIREGLPEGNPRRRRRPRASGRTGDVPADRLPHLRPDVGRRHQCPTHPLGQGADGCHHELGAQTRHQPVEAGRLQTAQHLHRNQYAHAVVGRPRLEDVLQAEREIALHPGVGVTGGVVPAGQQQLAGEVEQVRTVAALALPPGVEVVRAVDVVGQAVVVEVEQGLVAGQQPVLAAPLLDVGQLLHEFAVALHEAVAGVPAALHQPGADEHLPRQLAGVGGADRGERGRAVGHQGHPVQQQLLVHHGGTAARGPVRLPIHPVQQPGRPGRLLDPTPVDLGDRPREQAGSLHQLCRHHPVVALTAQTRARPDHEVAAAGTRILSAALVPGAHIGQQSHQQRAVDGVRAGRVRTATQGDDGCRHVPVGNGGRLRARLQAGGGRAHGARGGQVDGGGGESQRAGELPQLVVHVLPLAYPQVVEELGAAHAPEGGAGQVALLGAQVAPQVQVRQEVAGRLGEAPVQGIGGLLMVGGALAHVLHRQCRHDHHDLADAAAFTGLQQHAPQSRVDGQPGQAPAHLGQPRPADAVAPASPPPPRALAAGGLDGADLAQQLDAVAYGAGVGGVQEGEVLHVAQAERRHLQNHRGQRGAQDLRLGVLRARLEVGPGVQADGNTVGDAPAPSGALVGAGPTDRLDRQALHLGAVGVAGDARQARVDDVADAGHGQGGLGHVGGQHDASARVRLEHAVLLGGGQAREQRHHLDGAGGGGTPVRGVARAQVVDEGGFGIANVPLPGKEDQDVAAAGGHELVDGVEDAGDLVAVGLRRGLRRPGALPSPGGGGGVLDAGGVGVGVVELRREGPVADLHRVGASGHLDHRCGHPCGAGLCGGVAMFGEGVLAASGEWGVMAEVGGEALGVDGGGGDDDLQVWALGEEPGQIAEDEVDVQAALVRLVYDDRVVAAQQRV